MRRFAIPVYAGMLALGAAAFGQNYATEVPAGTNLEIRTNDSIDVRDRSDGRIYTAVLARDVLDRDGNIAIPRGATAELTVRNVGDNERALDLESITARGRRYVISGAEKVYGREGAGVGKNERTAKYVGGGALLGTIVGAIAGGGKGAAIGALAGGAGGAGAQTITRGKDIRVPSESIVTFRLAHPLELGRGDYSRDDGYSRDGHHYHHYTYQP